MSSWSNLVRPKLAFFWFSQPWGREQFSSFSLGYVTSLNLRFKLFFDSRITLRFYLFSLIRHTLIVTGFPPGTPVFPHFQCWARYVKNIFKMVGLVWVKPLANIYCQCLLCLTHIFACYVTVLMANYNYSLCGPVKLNPLEQR